MNKRSFHKKDRAAAPAPCRTPRDAALTCLLRWAEGGVFAETLIRRESEGMSAPDRALLQAIVMGTLRHLRLLEHFRYQLRSADLEPHAHWAVLMGLCQLFILKSAEYAAVSETVNTVSKRIRGVVNGMLRSALRRRSEFEESLPKLPLGVRYSTPDWLVERWVRQFGDEQTEALLAWNSQAAPVYARLNPLRPLTEPLPEADPLSDLPDWVRLRSGIPLDALRAGQVYVADPSTRHCIRLLAPCAGERILDACAAPGGKSAAILAATGGKALLTATDAEEHRIPQLRENLQRSGGKAVIAVYDWTQHCPPQWRERFDAVLLDVPCSNTGVLQRRIDARWRLNEDEISRLAALQLQILLCAADAVRPGGRLVYSTCSIDCEEDRAVVDAFLVQRPDFSFAEEYLALPHLEQADGAYAALLHRR